jgi:hypothetical protein
MQQSFASVRNYRVNEQRLSSERRRRLPRAEFRPDQEGGVAMASEPIRNPQTDHLITSENSALLIIDY